MSQTQTPMRNFTCILVLAFASQLSVAAAAHAQGNRVSAPDPSPANLCFRGRPLNRCRRFSVMELGVSSRVAGSEYTQQLGSRFEARPELDNHLSLDLGLMWNRSRRSATGVVAGIGGGGTGHRITLEARQRQWLTRRSAIDLSAGVVTGGIGAPWPAGDVRGVGATAKAAFNFADLAGVHLSADVIRAEDGRTARSVYAGAHVGSHATLITTLIATAYAAVFVLGMATTDF